MTPIGAKRPSAATGAIPAPAKDASPAAVVMLVRTSASPEWPNAWLSASARFSPRRMRSKKIASRWTESPTPTAEEFQRVKVEVHLGRDMDEALHAMAERVGSEDFQWVTEGIQIHREVGGDIAEIIDSVTATIRSRNQIRRRIRSLSAEGRISAIVLVALPIFLFVIISLVNPAYIGELTTSSLGRTLIMGAVVGMLVGIVWIKRIIRLEF